MTKREETRTKKSGELNGFLDRGSSFKGELEFEDTMRIDGKFNGRIVSKNELIVGETAQIDGDIQVGRIAISGTVIGKITAEQRDRAVGMFTYIFPLGGIVGPVVGGMFVRYWSWGCASVCVARCIDGFLPTSAT